jgi:PAS domain S-box-containing protein
MLVDLGLPDSQGLETFARLHDAAPGVAVIVLTGNSNVALAVRAVKEGAQDFLVKGQVNGELLTRAIGYALARKQAEQELGESEARYRALAERSPLAVFVSRNDQDNDTVLLVNPACMKLFGASSPEELIGRSALELFHPDSRGLVREPIREATSETVPFVEARIVKLDGTPVDVDISAAPLLDQGLPAIQVVLRDITEAKKVQERTARLAAIVTSSSDPILTKDLDETITNWNAAAEALYGYTEDEIVGTSMEVLVPPGREGEPRQLTERLRRGERIPGFETQRERKDGSLVDVSLTLFPILDDAGDIVSVSVITHDISERKRAEEALLESKAELAALNKSLERRVEKRTIQLSRAIEDLIEANEAKTRFLRSMSHELRTPLNSVIGFSSMLADGIPGEVNEEQGRQLAMINRSGKHLLSLINDILDLSRIEAGKAEAHTESIDVPELLDELVASVSPAAKVKELELELLVSDPPPSLSSDRRQIRQILLNFVANAIKFTDEGTVSLHAFQPSRQLVAFSVTDTGPGIAPGDQERIFDEFERGADQAATTEGTGLGLSISRGLAQSLGGTIDLVSEVGEGSTFTLTLPEKPGPTKV